MYFFKLSVLYHWSVCLNAWFLMYVSDEIVTHKDSEISWGENAPLAPFTHNFLIA